MPREHLATFAAHAADPGEAQFNMHSGQMFDALMNPASTPRQKRQAKGQLAQLEQQGFGPTTYAAQTGFGKPLY